ncbi:MAG: hypothetical protein ACOX5X_02065 [Acholeplasmataceae bacterium]|jgi:hypothetical protein
MKLFKKYGGFLALLFGVAAIAMLLISPAAKSGDKAVELTGFQLIFGVEESLLGVKTQILFNFLGFLALLLLVAGTVMPVVPLKGNLRYLLGTVLVLVAAILLFSFPATIQGKIGIFSASTDPIKLDYSPGTGIILSGVCAILSFLVNGVLGVLNLKK